MQQNLKKYRNTVDLEDAADAGLAYLVRVEQFELLGALVEVVTQGDAVAPALNLPALGPKLDINWVSGLEHPAKGADVDGSYKIINRGYSKALVVRSTRSS